MNWNKHIEEHNEFLDINENLITNKESIKFEKVTSDQLLLD